MSRQKFYVGSTGPFYYNDDSRYSDGEFKAAFRGPQIHLEVAASGVYEPVRLGDLYNYLHVSNIIVVDTTPYIVSHIEDLVICNLTTTLLVTLPPATGSGRELNFKNINIGLATIVAVSPDVIDNVTSKDLNQWDSLSLIDGMLNMWVIN